MNLIVVRMVDQLSVLITDYRSEFKKVKDVTLVVR